MKKLILIFVLSVGFTAIYGQDQDVSFEVTYSSDSIGLTEILEVKYTIKNMDFTDFQPPQMDDFRIIGGPNTSTSMRIINGESSKVVSFSYLLQAKDLGTYVLGEAVLTTEDDVHNTTWKKIVVVPNDQRPESAVNKNKYKKEEMEPLFPRSQPLRKPKKKRKIYGI